MKKKSIALLVPLLLFLTALFLPPAFFHLPGLTVIEQRVIAIFFLAAALWILEPIPIFATSVLVITLELLMLSDHGLKFLTTDQYGHFGSLLDYSEVMAIFASPVIILFLGGFFLALAASKYRLDLNLARVILKPFGSRPRWIIMGLMLITALFSMFMSNTATTAMMLAVVGPVLAAFPPGDRGRTGLVLAIPVAANIGGIGTPIGTPPNAIAMQYLTDSVTFSFVDWMLFAVPFILVMLLFSWWLLDRFFPSRQSVIHLRLEGHFEREPKAVIVYVVFGLTVLLWLLGDLLGLNSYVVAMIPMAVFSVTGVVGRADLKEISWDVLWLLSGGLALGLALEKTGLAARLVQSIPFGSFSPFMVLLAAASLALVMANFMSHTATANLLLPLMATLAPAIRGLEPFGGQAGLLVAVTLACSLGMSLPISTPPNALAVATGQVETRDLARIGLPVGLVGLLLSFLVVWAATRAGIFD
ncbi:MAG: DASS family sodium-coupled anion symporter [Deltaproteobacteria bacterium]|jgi:sodium-dependent dicarboxylate transporter 2/3/5|nr:DASS family sodium-coupled anion symporter [Deltaproteobacteria bacterium]